MTMPTSRKGDHLVGSWAVVVGFVCVAVVGVEVEGVVADVADVVVVVVVFPAVVVGIVRLCWRSCCCCCCC